MSKERIKYVPMIAMPLIVVLLLFFYSFWGKDLQATPAINQKAPDEKKIVVDMEKMKIFLYENWGDKKELSIPNNRKDDLLKVIPSGVYSINTISSAKFFEDILRLAPEKTKEISSFSADIPEVFILNASENKKPSIDEQGFYFSKKGNISFPKISAASALVGDLDNGSIIYSKNPEEKRQIASVTKLMTALVTMESLDQYKTITVNKKMLSAGYGDYGHLRLGENITIGELTYPLLLSSSNDAAYAISMDYGEESFMELINKKAEELGLTGTFLDDPSGVSDNDVSTANDLFQLAQNIFHNKRWIFDVTKLQTINYWRNNNYFAGNKKYLGGKTGYTDMAGETLVAAFSLPLSEIKNRNIAIVLLRSKDRESDALALLKWLESQVAYQEKIVPEKSFSDDDIKNFEKEMKKISLLFVGDIMLDRGVEESVSKNANGNFSFLFKNADFVKNYDISFGNLEGPVSDIGQDSGNTYSFRMHPAALSAIKEAGFDALSVANNHIADWGRVAFEDTLIRLKDENISPVDADLDIIEKNGIKVGFLGFSDFNPQWPEIVIDKFYGDKIKSASEKTDVLIISLHFGEEYQDNYNKRQEELAQLAIDNGAKIVVGHHPHHVQEIKKYKDGLIAYSLGNFVFDQNFSEKTMEGLALEVSISGTGKIKYFVKNAIKINHSFQPEITESIKENY